MSTVVQPPPIAPDILYPESDGKPMADNTRQFEWIVTIKGGLDTLLTTDFVAGDLLWYPVQGEPKVRQAPDVMVAVGRPKGHRSSYKQWEEDNVAPQVVFEILSPGNTFSEMVKKEQFYDRYGVEEYYIYDPDSHDLFGWVRTEGHLLAIPQMAGWTSPRLGIRFEPTPEKLEIYQPDGERFLTYLELEEQRKQERQRAEQEHQRAERLSEKLRALGIDPDQI